MTKKIVILKMMNWTIDSTFGQMTLDLRHCRTNVLSVTVGEYFSVRYRLKQMLRDNMNDEDKDDMNVEISEIDRIYF